MREKKAPPLLEGERAGDIRRASFASEARPVAEADLISRGYKKEDEDGRMLYEVAISSEAEIQRWFGLEVLHHDSDSVVMERINRSAPLLMNHNWDDQVGKVMPGTVRVDDDKKSRGWVRFSRSARGKEIEQDVDDKTRELTSVGYRVLEWEYEARAVGKDEKGKTKHIDVYHAMRWEPMEVSIVSIPADLTVGIGRSAAEPAIAAPAVSPAGEQADARRGPTKMDPEKAAPEKPEVQDHRSDGQRTRDQDAAEIVRMCDANGMGARAPEFIADGLTSAQVALEIIRLRGRPRESGSAPAGGDVMKGLRASDRKRYSYSRAILLASGEKKMEGIEAEVHQELQRVYQGSGLNMRSNSVLIPLDLRTPEQVWQDIERRALDSKTVSKGSETVFEQPGELIELLRSRSALVALGARTLTGLSGPIGFPKQTGAGTATWVSENPAADLSDSDLSLGLVMLAPKTIQSTTAYARQLLVQSSVDVENMVRNDLATIHALAWDRAGYHGQSAAGQPTGIYLAPDVSSTDFSSAAATYVKLLEMGGKVADKNADEGSLAFVTTPLEAASMKGIAEHPTGTMANWLWQGTFRDGTVMGYPARATNQISKTMLASAESGGSSHGIIFGNWNDMIIGMFGALEIVVDPYAKKKRGLIEVTSFQMCDIILRHGESFCKGVNLIP